MDSDDNLLVGHIAEFERHYIGNVYPQKYNLRGIIQGQTILEDLNEKYFTRIPMAPFEPSNISSGVNPGSNNSQSHFAETLNSEPQIKTFNFKQTQCNRKQIIDPEEYEGREILSITPKTIRDVLIPAESEISSLDLDDILWQIIPTEFLKGDDGKLGKLIVVNQGINVPTFAPRYSSILLKADEKKSNYKTEMKLLCVHNSQEIVSNDLIEMDSITNERIKKQTDLNLDRENDDVIEHKLKSCLKNPVECDEDIEIVNIIPENYVETGIQMINDMSSMEMVNIWGEKSDLLNVSGDNILKQWDNFVASSKQLIDINMKADILSIFSFENRQTCVCSVGVESFSDDVVFPKSIFSTKPLKQIPSIILKNVDRKCKRVDKPNSCCKLDRVLVTGSEENVFLPVAALKSVVGCQCMECQSDSCQFKKEKPIVVLEANSKSFFVIPDNISNNLKSTNNLAKDKFKYTCR